MRLEGGAQGVGELAIGFKPAVNDEINQVLFDGMKE